MHEQWSVMHLTWTIRKREAEMPPCPERTFHGVPRGGAARKVFLFSDCKTLSLSKLRWPWQMVASPRNSRPSGWWFRFWTKMTTSPSSQRRSTRSSCQSVTGRSGESPSTGRLHSTETRAPTLRSPTVSWTGMMMGGSSLTLKPAWSLPESSLQQGVTTFSR